MRRILGLVMLFVFLAGCQAAPSRQAPAGPQELTTIKIGVLPQTLSEKMVDLLIPAFQDENPSIRVEKVVFAWGDLRPFTDAADQGQLDVVATEYTNRFQKRALDPYIARSRFDLTPYGRVLDQVRTGGVLDEMPYAFWPTVLVYNKAMLAEANVAVPAPGWTWDAFRDTLRHLARGQGDAKVWGLQVPWSPYLMRAWMAGKTGQLSPVVEPLPFMEGLEYFSALVQQDQSLPRDPRQEWEIGRTSIFFDVGLKALNEGKTAFAAVGLSSMGELADRITVEWDVAPMPAFPGQRPVSVAMPLAFAIPVTAADPDAAWEFVSFAAGPEGARLLTQAGYQVFYNTDGVREAWELAQKRLPPGASVVWQTDWVLDRWVLQHSSDQERAFARAVNEVLSGTLEIPMALNGYRLDLAGRR